MTDRRRRHARPTPPREPDLFPNVGHAAKRVEESGEERVQRITEELGPLFPGVSIESAVSIATLTQTARDLLEGAMLPLWVRGEVTDFKAHRNGHWYFCLRDATAQIRCVVWSRDRRSIPAPPDDGMSVCALGQLTVYPARGEMQFAIRRLEAEGDGLWRRALDRTIATLRADGLLAPERKRALPRYPRSIAVVTSRDGAAIHDILAVIRQRAPAVRLVLLPTAVQGEGAPRELARAIDRVGRWGGADTLIVGRGGGGREDLWAFNDERVARSLAASPIPTISAVGHEIDLTVCDLVADWRAPTPSAAAAAAVEAYDEVESELRGLNGRLQAAIGARLAEAHRELAATAHHLLTGSRRAAERQRARIDTLAARLHGVSPLATLARGYSLARDDERMPMTTIARFVRGQSFELLVRDGRVIARTESTQPGPPDSFGSEPSVP